MNLHCLVGIAAYVTMGNMQQHAAGIENLALAAAIPESMIAAIHDSAGSCKR
jgi:hypothetical protein